jgi:glycosyltransferase involved in cell wall biosynthesis
MGNSKKRLLLVALLVPIKGVPYLLEALAILREKCDDFVLDIVGDGPNRSEYEELTRKLGLQDVVRFHGLKSKQEVADFMRQADIFVLPSEWENLPCVIIEAMASGLPVVATNVGGIPEMVSDEVGILVQPGDARDLAEALGHILEHLDQYQSGKIAGQAKQRFSYTAVSQMLVNLY